MMSQDSLIDAHKGRIIHVKPVKVAVEDKAGADRFPVRQLQNGLKCRQIAVEPAYDIQTVRLQLVCIGNTVCSVEIGRTLHPSWR